MATNVTITQDDGFLLKLRRHELWSIQASLLETIGTLDKDIKELEEKLLRKKGIRDQRCRTLVSTGYTGEV